MVVSFLVAELQRSSSTTEGTDYQILLADVWRRNGYAGEEEAQNDMPKQRSKTSASSPNSKMNEEILPTSGGGGGRR